MACDTKQHQERVPKKVEIGSNALDLNSRVDADEEEAKTVIQISCGFEERLLGSIKNRFDFTVLSDENTSDFSWRFFPAKRSLGLETGREMQIHRPCGVDRGVLRGGGRIHGYLSTQPNPCFFVD